MIIGRTVNCTLAGILHHLPDSRQICRLITAGPQSGTLQGAGALGINLGYFDDNHGARFTAIPREAGTQSGVGG